MPAAIFAYPWDDFCDGAACPATSQMDATGPTALNLLDQIINIVIED